MNKIFSFFRKILHLILPKNRYGDKLYSYLNFIFNHKGRLPKKRDLFNDYYYQLKTSDEILNPLRVFVTDKEYGKIYIKSIVGNEYNVPTFKILKSTEDVEKYSFPKECVVKPTHMSGYVIFKRESDILNLSQIKKWFSMNYYNRSREANYKNLKPKVIVEELLFGNTNLSDIKFFCYKGLVKLIQIDHDRNTNHRRSLFTPDWKKQNYSMFYEQYKEKLEKPKNLEKMISTVNLLAKSLDFRLIRIDGYSNNEKFYIGEITNIHGNASEIFYPSSGEAEASKLIFS